MSLPLLKDMVPEVALKWVEALESGDYVQAQGRLAIDDKYCCLGVLCEIAVSEGVISSYDPDDYAPAGMVLVWAFGDPDLRTVNQYDAETQIFTTDKGDNTESLAYRNDGGASFGTIASIIREEVGL